MQERKVNKSTFVGLIEPEMDEQEHIKASEEAVYTCMHCEGLCI